MAVVEVFKEGKFLRFSRPNRHPAIQTAFFDLDTAQCYHYTKSKGMYEVYDLGWFFRGVYGTSQLTISNHELAWVDGWINCLIDYQRSWGHNNTIGRALSEVEARYLVSQQYYQLGLNSKYRVTRPVSTCSKDLIHLMCKLGSDVFWTDTKLELAKDQYSTVKYIDTLNLTLTAKSNLFKTIVTNNDRYTLIGLKTHLDYTNKALINYLIHMHGAELRLPNYYLHDTIRTLRDTHRMANEMGIKIKKYPKNLHVLHDQLIVKYNLFKTEYDKKRFLEAYEDTDFEYQGKEYSIIIPTHPGDLKNEGKALNHCVGSYVSSVIRGDCWIVFLRSNDDLDTPLATLQFKSQRRSMKMPETLAKELRQGRIPKSDYQVIISLVQAKIKNNNELTDKQEKFVSKYLKKKGFINSVFSDIN